MIDQNYRRVLERIKQKALAVGRDPGAIKLVVVTKGHPVDAVERVITAGASSLGENYVDEALKKMEAVGDRTAVEWHMIGHVQSRKARAVCESFTFLHSLDSLKLARRLDRFAEKNERVLPVLLECNVSGEGSKFGWRAWQEDKWPELLPEVEQLLAMPNIQVKGLMTMPPYSENAESSRSYFKMLRDLGSFFAHHCPQADWSELSMGMSIDYDIAIEEGATMLRIGTEIMGPRPPR